MEDKEMKLKRFLAVALSLAMVTASFAGCGKKDEGSESDVFKIGGIGPTTGGAASYGLAVKHGAELAVKEINEAGGINGYQIEFKFEDDEHNPEIGRAHV